MGKIWEINSRLALWTYKAILLPKRLYVSVGWWLMVSKVEARNLLQSLQGSYLRATVGSMKTAPTNMLEVALCQTTLNLATFETAGLTA
jgi:hypothetical protein